MAKNLKTLGQEVKSMLGTRQIFDQTQETTMRLRFQPSTNAASKVLFIYGDNASGKSLLRRILASIISAKCKSNDSRFEHLEVSMRTRTGGGMRSSFMYGPVQDDENSSGAVSLGPLNGLFNSAKDRDFPTLVSIDEAEIGLSQSYHYALGQYIANRHLEDLEPKEKHLGTIVITHSTEMAKGLIESLPAPPHVIAMGGYMDLSLEQWLEGLSPRKNVEDLKALKELNRQRHRAFEAFFG